MEDRLAENGGREIRMKLKCRYKSDAGLYEYAGTNMLYELVKLYGAYIEYKNKVDENEFAAFYNNMKDRVLYRYINLANNEAKNYLLKQGELVTSKKLRRIIITRRKSFVYSYSWMPLYVEYVTNKIFEDDVLTKYATEYILKQCDFNQECSDVADRREWQMLICKQALLGFQFNFLKTVKATYPEKKSHMAETILETISSDAVKIVNSCTK